MSERCRNRRGLQNVFRGLSLESRFAYFVSMASYTTQQKGIFRKTKGNASLHQRRKVAREPEPENSKLSFSFSPAYFRNCTFFFLFSPIDFWISFEPL